MRQRSRRAAFSWVVSATSVAGVFLACEADHRSRPPRDPATLSSGISSAPSQLPTSSAVASADPIPEPPPPPVVEPATSPEDPLPASFTRISGDGETQCGSLRIQVLAEAPGAFRRFVRVLGPDGGKLYEAHGRHYKLGGGDTLDADLTGEFCGDLTGDGIPELALTESTMGAHCCYTRYVVSMTTPVRRLLMWEKGDAGTSFLPVKYGTGTDWQLEDLLVVWPPFNTEKGDPVLSYASAPLVPVVFSLSSGVYKMTSQSFPQPYARQRERIREECKKDPTGCWGDILLWIDSLAIGDWETARAEIHDVELRASLERRTPAMKRVLKGLGSVTRPIDVTPKTR